MLVRIILLKTAPTSASVKPGLLHASGYLILRLIIFNNVHVNFFKLLHPGNVPSTQRAIIYTKLAQQVYSTWNAFLSGGAASEFLVRNC